MRAARLNDSSQCNDCKHRQAYMADIKTTSCDAFADIPNIIIRNQHDHTKPYPGDNGILFKAVEKFEKSNEPA